MKAIIMAGGEGRRLRPVSGDTPKPMARLLGRPVIDHAITLLRQHGFTELIASLGYKADVIESHLGNGREFGIHIKCCTEPKPLGTAGGVKLAWNQFAKGEDILVISGDAACDLDLSLLRQEHLQKRPAVTMALHRHSEPLGYGLVLTDKEGFVSEFIEKPSWERVVTDLVNTGIYILSPEALELVPDDRPFDFAKDLFPILLETGRPILGIPLPGYWCDIGTPEDYYRCNLDALHGRLRLLNPWGKDQPEKAAPPPPPKRRRWTHSAEFPCRDRAALMRVLSENLVEFGADFSDGLTLSLGEGSVHISPASDRGAVIIGAEGENADKLCRQYREVTRKLYEEL